MLPQPANTLLIRTSNNNNLNFLQNEPEIFDLINRLNEMPENNYLDPTIQFIDTPKTIPDDSIKKSLERARRSGYIKSKFIKYKSFIF